MAKILQSAEEFENVIKGNVVVVDLFADWCGPCRMVAPVIEELSHEYAGKAEVVKLNVDLLETIAYKYRVNTIPTLIYFKNGVEVGREIGFRPKSQIAASIEKML